MPEEGGKKMTPEQAIQMESDKLGHWVSDLARRLEAEEVSIDELVDVTMRAFMTGTYRVAYLKVLYWAAQYKDGYPEKKGRAIIYKDVNPVKNSLFRQMFMADLTNDISERLRQSGDLLSALKYLNSGVTFKAKPLRLTNLADELGL